MDRRDVISRLKAAEPAIREQGVAALYLYGSYARDDAHTKSDIDILVDFEGGRGIGVDGFMGPYRVLEDCFPGVEIGYGTRDTLVEHYRPHIEQSAIRIF